MNLKPVLPTVDVIVCFRNERRCISSNLRSIQNQDYPKDQLQITYVNDHSTDGGEILIPQNGNVRLLNLAVKTGKKAAQRLAIHNSSSDYIVFSDADCIYPKTWLTSLVGRLLIERKKLMCGRVNVPRGENFLEVYQYFDFKTNVALSHFCLEKSKVALGSAANLIVSRDFLMSLGALPNEQLSSGDDVFLLQSALKKDRTSVGFNCDESSLVITEAEPSWVSFIAQRRRWMSKFKFYAIREKVFFGFLGLVDFVLLALGVLSFFSTTTLIFFVSLCLLKTLLFSRYTKETNFGALFFFLLIQLPINFILSVLSMLFPGPAWKDRRIGI